MSGAPLRVFVRGLRIQAQVGLYAHERGRTQPLVVDITVELAPSGIAHLHDTLDYTLLAGAARALAAEGHVELVETFAQRLAAACLADRRVLTATVRVEKPEAIPDADAAGVELALTRGEQS